MTNILQKIFGNSSIRKYYDEIESLNDVKIQFEEYLFLIYEKTCIIAEIKNKYHEILNKDKGYIKEDERKFTTQIENPYGLYIYNEKIGYFYKKWLNKRLKRIKKIIDLEIKSKVGVYNQKNNIVQVVNHLIHEFENIEINDDLEILQEFVILLKKLEENLSKQKKYLDNIYPIKEWNLEVHENILSENFMDLILKELKLIFGEKNSNKNYNFYPAFISKSIHDANIPQQSQLKKLIENKIEKVKTKKTVEKIELVKCYHARPITITSPLFPLDIKTKETGFFVDLNMNEAKIIVINLYGLNTSADIELFEMNIPKNLFKYAISDPYGVGLILEEKISTDNSFLFRPSTFPHINEFFIKGLIKYKKISYPY